MIFVHEENKCKHIGIRIDRATHYKLHFVSKYEGRSANGQILYLVRKNIKEFENANGKIEIPPEENKSSEQSTNFSKK